MTFDFVEKVPKDFRNYLSQIYNKILFEHENRREMNSFQERSKIISIVFQVRKIKKAKEVNS